MTEYKKQCPKCKHIFMRGNTILVAKDGSDACNKHDIDDPVPLVEVSHDGKPSFEWWGDK